MNWQEWWNKNGLDSKLLPERLKGKPWNPSKEDQKAAWDFYTEIRTRITTQPLHYRAGDEEGALNSVYKLFEPARDIIKRSGPACSHFADCADIVLNDVIRPFTAKWHKRREAGHLKLEDHCHEFRAELNRLQQELGNFHAMFGRFAEGVTDVNPGEVWWKTLPLPVATADQFAAWPASARDRRQNTCDAIGKTISFAIHFDDTVPTTAQTAIRTAEQAEIKRRREASGVKDTNNLVGLAISGGGIRSASFALGIVSRLAQAGLMKEVDYISTVSGGGYLGSFLSSFLNNTNPEVGLEAGKQPFLGQPNAAVQTAEPESAALRWIRNHSKFLFYGGTIRKLQGMGMVLYGVLINLFITLPLPVLAAMVTKGLWEEKLSGSQLREVGPSFPMLPMLWFVSLAIAAGMVLFLGPIQVLVKWLKQKHSRSCETSNAAASEQPSWLVGFQSFQIMYETVCALIVPVMLVILVINSLSLIACWFDYYCSRVGGLWLLSGAAALPFVCGILSAVFGRFRLVSKLFMVLLAVAGPLFLVVVYLLLVEFFVVAPTPSCTWAKLWILGGVPLLYGLFMLNINFSSPHRFYRNRLSHAFMIRPATDGKDSGVHRPEHVDVQKLSDLRRQRAAAPYHLINCALNLPASSNPNLRGRDADFFVFSQNYCGSPLSGYFSTEEFEQLDGSLDLATAMAISGAAASPHMGYGTVKEVSFLMTLLNVRLGYWMRNPAWNQTAFGKLISLPVFASGWYLFREMFGRLHERTIYLNLSDGGHIENLAIYELLRRRCKFIVAIDGEGDPKLTCFSLMRVMRLAEIDFGIRMNFLDLDDVKLQPTGFSKSHFTLGVIDYGHPPGAAPGAEREIGLILYLKLTLTGNESPTLHEYRQREPLFPQHPTSQQFFTEEQFESYRALGQHVAEEVLRAELFNGQCPPGLTVKQWFEAIVKCLLPE